jgi:hypothetical protein
MRQLEHQQIGKMMLFYLSANHHLHYMLDRTAIRRNLGKTTKKSNSSTCKHYQRSNHYEPEQVRIMM